ncbi:hypothetical protein HHI36_002246 [Cryptolaemus montrouzieri]|uniref:Transposase n=1 Tax=Cryptolaemus montrouzieri TaxID=559131 RepID=A0ABD2PAC0_9CUCU
MVKTKSGDPLRSPRKKRNREKPVVHIDDFDQTAIRNTIYDKLQNKEHITLSALKEKLLEKDIFNGCKTSLWKIVQNIGFKYSKDNRRRVLMELPHIALKRIHFLQSYIRIKNEGLREFAYLDETWIFKDGTIGRSWQDDNIKSVNKTKVGGTRFIILHAGNSHGFIPSAELVFFSSKTLDSDYHGKNESRKLQALVCTPTTVEFGKAFNHYTR